MFAVITDKDGKTSPNYFQIGCTKQLMNHT